MSVETERERANQRQKWRGDEGFLPNVKITIATSENMSALAAIYFVV